MINPEKMMAQMALHRQERAAFVRIPDKDDLDDRVLKPVKEVQELRQFMHRLESPGEQTETRLRAYLGKAAERKEFVEYVAYATKRAGLAGSAGIAAVEIHHRARNALELRAPGVREQFASALYNGLREHRYQLLDPLVRPRR